MRVEIKNKIQVEAFQHLNDVESDVEALIDIDGDIVFWCQSLGKWCFINEEGINIVESDDEFSECYRPFKRFDGAVVLRFD